jgi:hypothetical protein
MPVHIPERDGVLSLFQKFLKLVGAGAFRRCSLLQPSDPTRPSPNPLEQPEDSAAEKLRSPSTRAFAIREVVARELQQVRLLCGLRNVNDRLNPVCPRDHWRSASDVSPEQFGVCISGGGIRRASVM